MTWTCSRTTLGLETLTYLRTCGASASMRWAQAGSDHGEAAKQRNTNRVPSRHLPDTSAALATRPAVAVVSAFSFIQSSALRGERICRDSESSDSKRAGRLQE